MERKCQILHYARSPIIISELVSSTILGSLSADELFVNGGVTTDFFASQNKLTILNSDQDFCYMEVGLPDDL